MKMRMTRARGRFSRENKKVTFTEIINLESPGSRKPEAGSRKPVGPKARGTAEASAVFNIAIRRPITSDDIQLHSDKSSSMPYNDELHRLEQRMQRCLELAMAHQEEWLWRSFMALRASWRVEMALAAPKGHKLAGVSTIHPPCAWTPASWEDSWTLGTESPMDLIK